VDEKFTEVIRVLVSRGWERSYDIFDDSLELVWMNYVNIKFERLFEQYVNHFSGSKHFSNKVD